MPAVSERRSTAREPPVTRDEAGLASSIRRSQKVVTIMFTDIEGSTRLWDLQGDVRGRLAVDQHNRLVLPLVRRFRGRVIKTIGDAVMASFRQPEDAVKASVAIQQVLERRRRADPDFKLRVRVGIHTGRAVVERSDVYGNVVNAAARLESCADGNEIVLSGATLRQLPRGARRTWHVGRGKRLTPRGQRRPLTVFSIDWQAVPELVTGELEALVTPVQRVQFIAFGAVSLFGAWHLYSTYLRYLLVDREPLALLLLEPRRLLWHPLATPALVALAVLAALALYRLRRRPWFVLRLLHGGVGFTVLYLAGHLALPLVPAGWLPERWWSVPIHTSSHLLTEVLETTPLRDAPALEAKEVGAARRGAVLLLTGARKAGGITWSRVLVGSEKHAWIPRVVPARIGVPEIRYSLTRTFELRWHHLYAMGLGLLGFLLGLFFYRLDPA